MTVSRALSALFLVLLVVSSLFLATNTYSQTGQKPPLYVAFIWHYHQPWYFNENETGFILPWVRMHSVGNYYKMGYILEKYPDVKVTFTFSGSLLVQLVAYVEKGLMDYRQELSWKIANGSKLTDKEIFDMLKTPGGFFDINWNRFVEQIPRYKVLRDKAQSIMNTCSETAKTTEELYSCVADQFAGPNREYFQRVIDLAVMFNLYWIDPLVAKEQYPDIYSLMQKGYTTPAPKYTLDDLRLVLNTQMDIMRKIIPLYKDLVSKGQAELIPVPYSHPLAPIITDLGWRDDIVVHVMRSIEVFNQEFNYTPKGIWPAEQAVNEYVLAAFANAGMKWTVTDQSILAKTGVDAGNPVNLCSPWYVEISGNKIYVVFRNTELSNLISFDYSKYSADDAVNDLASRITGIANQITDNKPHLLVIALDGENPWENYEQFGDLFLTKLYAKLSELQSNGVIRTITPGSFVEMFPDDAKQLPYKTYTYLDLAGKDISNLPMDSYGDAYAALPRKQVNAHIPEGSWGGGELSIWIGDRQENTAWMWLKKAREDVFKALNVTNIYEAYNKSKEAVEYLLRAEASDWFWWYGWDGGGSPETFDPLFKAFLRRAYIYAGVQPPNYLYASFYPDGESRGWLNSYVPKPLKKPIKIDGLQDRVWARYIADQEGLNITVGPYMVKNMYLGVDGYGLYLSAIPWNINGLGQNSYIAVYLSSPRRSLSPYSPGYNVYMEHTNRDPGLAIAFEIRIYPGNMTGEVLAADGRGGYVKLYELTVGVGEVVETYIPWQYLGLLSGDPVYITIASYESGVLKETSTRLGKTYKIKVPPPPSGGATGKVLFDMKDPEGDDDGPGGYQYPKNKVFQPGVFDMLEFKVIEQEETIRMEVTVKNLGDNPWGGPNGFCLQYVHIYIHTTLPVPGRTDTIGLNVNISDNSAWHLAILLAPGWDTAPVPDGQKAAIYYYNKTVVVQGDKFKVYADETTNKIIAEIDKSLIPDLNNASKWKYVVALTSYDGYGPQRIRSITPQAGEWTIGAPGYEQAIIAGVLPRIMDLLAPTPEDQYSMLRSFDPETGKFAVLEGYSSQQPVSPTKTVTTTITSTETVTETESTTFTTTVTTTTTKTETVVSTTTTTETKTETVEHAPGPVELSAYILVGLAVGIVLMMAVNMVLRRRQ